MSSPDTVVRFDHVSKRYAHRSLSARTAWWNFWKGHVRSHALPSPFWAVHDVCFGIHRGEVVGMIGRNGAGKSTILKLIAGITAPSSGTINVDGTVGALIELGAGFNPDLTGRENIYLNAGMLGLTRTQITERFDRIVAFSGLGEFLDTPVKYYSSGMYARLGFAIAVHVEADVLLTDEILAVGDAAFQRQCLQTIRALKQTATIIFVSHDLVKVRQLCSRVLWIEDGRLQAEGDPDSVVDAYLDSLVQEGIQPGPPGPHVGQSIGEIRYGNRAIEIVAVTIHDHAGGSRSLFRTHEDIRIRLHYRIRGPYCDPGFGIRVHDANDCWVHGTNTFLHGIPVKLEADSGHVELWYQEVPLLAGEYWISAGVTSANDWKAPYDLRERACKFEILNSQVDGGTVCLTHQWKADG